MELKPLIEAGALANALDGAAIVADVFFGRNVGGAHERLQGSVRVKGASTEGVDVCDGGGRRVAIHDVGGAAEMGPAVPSSVVLLGLAVQALRDVTSAFRIEPGEQLEL